jgi:excisionase family DNA binding protein
MNELILLSKGQLNELLSQIIRDELKPFKNLQVEKSNSEEDEFITFNEAIRMLRISRPTLFKRIKDGTIPHRRIGKRLLFPKQLILRTLNKKETLLRTNTK